MNELAVQIEREVGTKPFGAVEDEIDALPLSSERKAALWLLAWSCLPRRRQRRLARSYVDLSERLAVG